VAREKLLCDTTMLKMCEVLYPCPHMPQQSWCLDTGVTLPLRNETKENCSKCSHW
jgi:hypothetical protein